MKQIRIGALCAALLATSVVTMPALADVSASIRIGPKPKPPVWYGPPGPCATFRHEYGTPWHNCGYAYWRDPVFIEGRWRQGPFYYRHFRGQHWYWWHGAWRRNEWRGAYGGYHGFSEGRERDER